MKKTLLLMSLGAFTMIGLTGCSEDETISVNEGNGIEFRPAMGTRTRATEITNSNLESIKVAAFMQGTPYFETTDFVKGETGFFSSTPVYHWPGDDTELEFYAYAPAAPGGMVSLTSDSKILTDFTPATNIADQVDFITSYAKGNRSANEESGVELTFNHQLSQIEVYAKSDNDAYIFKISGIRIGQPVSKGSFDFTNSSWTLGSDKAIYEETYSSPRILTSVPASMMGDEGNAILLPQQLVAWDHENNKDNSAKGAYLSVKLQANTKAGAQVYPFPSNGDCQWAAIPLPTNWEAGKKYVYTLDFTEGAGFVDPEDPEPGTPVLGGPIKFTVDVVDWTDSAIDMPMKTD